MTFFALTFPRDGNEFFHIFISSISKTGENPFASLTIKMSSLMPLKHDGIESLFKSAAERS